MLIKVVLCCVLFCSDNVSGEEVYIKIQASFGEYDELLTMVKNRKLK